MGPDADAGDFSAFNQNALDTGTFQNLPAASDEGATEVISEFLRTAARVVIPQKVGQPQHGVEEVRRTGGERAPVRRVSGQQRLQARIAKMLVQLLSHRVALEFSRLLVVPAFEVIQQAVKISLA